jgi:hypothetical protein
MFRATRVARAAWISGVVVLATCARQMPPGATGDVDTGSGPDAGSETGAAPEVAAALPPQTPQRLWPLDNRQLENVLTDVLGTSLGVTRGFLPDPRVDGFDDDAVARGVSDSRVDELATAAERAAAFVAAPERLMHFAPCADGDDQAEGVACARTFARMLSGRAWGRPATDDELNRLDEVFRAGRDPEGYASGIELVTEAVLQSPYFVYRLELGTPTEMPGVVRLTADETATALSFLLAGSRPDAELLRAAAAGELDTAAGRAAQARRLLAQPSGEGRRQLASFIRDWLELGDVVAINKDTGLYGYFTLPLRQALARELDTFLEHVLTHGAALDELFTADYTFPSPELSVIYGDDLLSPAGDFQRVALAPRRRGLLSSPAFLARHALATQTNPVERGLVILTRLFCKDLPPPPRGVAGTVPTGMPEQTTRQKYAAHESQEGCAACHQTIDPPGFALEAFDSTGRFRTTEAGQPIDSRGALVGTDVDGPFDGPAQLAARLVTSAQFHRCASRLLWQWSVGRAPRAGDSAFIDALTAEVATRGFRLDDWMVSFVSRPDFVLRRTAPQETDPHETMEDER